jgi:hypothetical protein
MKVVLSIVFWITIGPSIFFLLLDLLIIPAKWAADSIWGAQLPTSARVGVAIYSLAAMILVGRVVWLLWKRVRLFLASDFRANTWFDQLPPSFGFPLAVGAVLVGAAVELLVVGGQLPLAQWRQDAILFGGLLQGIGLLGIVSALRRRTQSAAQQGAAAAERQ